jgi:hypothetical protein
LIFIGFVVDLINNRLSGHGRNTNAIVNIFALVETLFLLHFFSKILLTDLVKKLIKVSAVIFSVAWLIFFVLYGKSKILEAILPVEAITIIILSIYFFYEQMSKPESPIVYMQARFWVVIAYLIYTAGTFFLFLYFDSLPLEKQKELYILNNGFLILKSILLSIAIFMKDNKSTRTKFQLT